MPSPFAHQPRHASSLPSAVEESQLLIFGTIVRWLQRVEHIHNDNRISTSIVGVNVGWCGSNQDTGNTSNSNAAVAAPPIVCNCPHIGLSFNGGKDCVVILTLFQHVINNLLPIGNGIVESGNYGALLTRESASTSFRGQLRLLVSESHKLNLQENCDRDGNGDTTAKNGDVEGEVTSILVFVERLMEYLTTTTTTESTASEVGCVTPATCVEGDCPSSLERLLGDKNTTCSWRMTQKRKDIPPTSHSKIAELQRFISAHLCVFYMEDEAEKEEQRDFRNLLLFHTMRCPRVVSVVVPGEDGDEGAEGAVVVAVGDGGAACDIQPCDHYIDGDEDEDTAPIHQTSPPSATSSDSRTIDVMQLCVVASVQTAATPPTLPKSSLSPSMLSSPNSPVVGMPISSSYSSLSSNLAIGQNSAAISPNSHMSKKRTLCMKAALSAVTGAFKMVDVLLGTRCEDPSAQYQQNGLIDATSKGWPSLIRVSPIFNWSYPQVWQYIFDGDVPFCPVYAHGYSSIGGKDTCGQNPHLSRNVQSLSLCTSSTKSASSTSESDVVLPVMDANVLASWVSWWGRRREYHLHLKEPQHHSQQHSLVSWSMNAVVETIRKVGSIKNNSNSRADKTSTAQDEVSPCKRGYGHSSSSSMLSSSTRTIPPCGWSLLVHEFTTELDTIKGPYDPSTFATTTSANGDIKYNASSVDGTMSLSSKVENADSWWPGWVLVDGTLERAGRHIQQKKPV